MSSFIPSRESELVPWSHNFAAVLTDEPEPYGVTVEQATAFAALQTAFASAYQYANDPATRSPTNIQSKDQAKDAMVASARELARIVQAVPGMDNIKRSRLGISLRDDEPTPVPVPSEPPVIDVVSVLGHAIRLRLHHGDSTRRGKPHGVSGATVFTYVGDLPPVDLASWKFEGNITRTATTLEMPSTVPAGSKVWVTAFWFNTKAQSGPAATPRSVYVGYGSLSQAA